jgi:hypothetical protein
MTEPAAARAASFDATGPERTARLVVLLSLLLTAIALAYFHATDQYSSTC